MNRALRWKERTKKQRKGYATYRRAGKKKNHQDGKDFDNSTKGNNKVKQKKMKTSHGSNSIKKDTANPQKGNQPEERGKKTGYKKTRKGRRSPNHLRAIWQ